MEAYLATFVRVAGWAQTAPVIGTPNVPARVRVGLSLLLALVLAPLRAQESVGLYAIPAELALGIMAGFSTRLVLAGLESGGQLIGLLLGVGFAGLYDPAIGEESLPTRRIMYALGGLAFLAADGLESAIRVLAVAPIDGQTLEHAARSLFDGGGRVMAASLHIAAPLMVASMISNVGAALASRAAPALNAFSVMLAVFLLVGTAALIATAPTLIQALMGYAAMAADAPQSLFGQRRF